VSVPDRPAVFLDRDGVLVADGGVVTSADQLDILPRVPEALRVLKAAGHAIVVVTNQAVVARGLLSEEALGDLHRALDQRLQDAGAPAIDAWFACPHHPHANVAAYRQSCSCRKPAPGLLLQAADTLALDLSASVLVGDRLTDIEAAAAAGCRSCLIDDGGDTRQRIVGPPPSGAVPDHTTTDLWSAAQWWVTS
jgi:D-glycero-D-manno-heptose 1,7-bisphosphate phosphatase